MDSRILRRVLTRWLWLIVLLTAVGGLLALGGSRLMAPVYRASATVLIDQSDPAGTVDYESILLGDKLTKTYSERVKSRPILQKTAEAFASRWTVDRLDSATSVTVIRETQLIVLSVDDTDPAFARDTANYMVELFVNEMRSEKYRQFAVSTDRVKRLLAESLTAIAAMTAEIERKRAEPNSGEQVAVLQSQLLQQQAGNSGLIKLSQDLQLNQGKIADSIRIAATADLPVQPYRPNVTLNVGVGTVLGLLIGLGIAVAFSYSNNAIEREGDLLGVAGVSFLGVVNGLRRADRRLLAWARDPQAPPPIGLNIQYLLPGVTNRDSAPCGQALLVTSATAVEGTSALVAGLAIELAASGRRVIVVDAKLHRPTLHEVFGIPDLIGLAEILANPRLPVVSVLRRTVHPNVLVLPGGAADEGSRGLLGAPAFAHLIDHLRVEADVILIDSAPTLQVADAVLMSAAVDRVILVAEAGRTRLSAVNDAKAVLRRAGTPAIGVVLNTRHRRSPRPGGKPTRALPRPATKVAIAASSDQLMQASADNR